MNGRSEFLVSWKEIAGYLGRGVRTVQRWELEAGLPVRRPSGHLRASVLAVRKELDDWATTRPLRVTAGVTPATPKSDASPAAARA